MSDPIAQLTHDHGELNRRVIALGVQMQKRADVDALLVPLRDLREQLFLHFAREEEGLFPFVLENLAELGDRIHEMELAHDAICGALARMVHLAQTSSPIASFTPLFDRFETAYATHAQMEGELLATLATKLDGEQRTRLAALVDGL
ncbi:MAG: hemerythrin domain-containing protein [Myxococcota bacterium]|nr:hemerythrin domain-containing protein [Myxococcota bacterium]